MSDLLSGMIGGRKESSGEPLTREQQDEVVAAKLRARARAEFSELQLTGVRGGLFADERGDLYEPLLGTVFTSSGELMVDRRDVAGFVLTDPFNGSPFFVRRVQRGPSTLDELEAQRDEQRKQREKAEHDRLKQLEKTPKTPVTANELIDVDPAMSLRSAAYEIERKGGEIRLRSDELVIELPERTRYRGELMQECKLLFASGEIVSAALRSKRGVDSLPTSPLRGGEL